MRRLWKGASIARARKTPLTIAEAIATSSIPRHEALVLLAFASGYTREQLIARSSDSLTPAASDTFAALALRRAGGEPIAYLLGRREFYGRDFVVDPRVLIPRPETELLVELALEWASRRRSAHRDRPLRVLDLGTGSGAIAITLRLECPDIEVTATDVSKAALEIAARNARDSGALVRLVQSDWLAAFNEGANGPQPFDLIVSNPPYIAAGDPHLSEGDLRCEPRRALTDESDGLHALRRIIVDAGRHLQPDGCLMLEHGYDQAAAVRELLFDSGFTQVTSSRDFAGIERITHGSRSSARISDRNDLQGCGL